MIRFAKWAGRAIIAGGLICGAVLVGQIVAAVA